MEQIAEILFFVNILLALSAALGVVLSFVLVRKTQLFRKYGTVCAVLLIFAFVVLCGGVLLKFLNVEFVAGFIDYILIGSAGLYFVANWAAIPYVRKVSDLFEKPRGIKFGANCLVFPPLGQVIIVFQLNGNRVIPTREMCLSGDALTYAALNSYRAAFGSCDYAEEDATVPELSEAEIKARAKELKHCSTPEEQYRYGLFIAYYMPDNTRAAMNAFESAAKGGIAPAYKQLGYMYIRSGRNDSKKAEKCFKNALQRGDESAELPLGILYCRNGRPSEGMSLFNQRAYNSNPYGFYNTGVCYEQGNGVKENISSALEFYMRAAERNCLVAQKRLFVLLAEYAFKEFESKLSVDDFNHIQDWAQKSAYNGFRCMANALLYIATQEIKDTSTSLLLAVRCRGYWERYARTLIGTIYADCGASAADRDNGVKYVQTAIDMGDRTAEELLPFVEKLVESKNAAEEERNNSKTKKGKKSKKSKNKPSSERSGTDGAVADGAEPGEVAKEAVEAQDETDVPKKFGKTPKAPKPQKPTKDKKTADKKGKKSKAGADVTSDDLVIEYEVPDPDDIIDGKFKVD